MVETGASTLEDLLHAGRDRLAKAGIDDPALDSRLLVEHFTATTRAHAITAPRRPIEAEIVTRIAHAVERRASGEPVHRIIGFRAFYGLDLQLSHATLEPRPDTETLIDAILPFVRETVATKGRCRILDLGTGTGAIALALLSQVKEAVATGVDISADALRAASSNAEAIGLGDRFTAIRSDWFGSVSGQWDVIVSNPPYIPSGSIAGLAREVRDHEPIEALDGGPDGLSAYRRIAEQVSDFLERSGRIALEIGFDQKDAVSEVFAAYDFECLAALRDLGGNDRVLVFAPKNSHRRDI